MSETRVHEGLIMSDGVGISSVSAEQKKIDDDKIYYCKSIKQRECSNCPETCHLNEHPPKPEVFDDNWKQD